MAQLTHKGFAPIVGFLLNALGLFLIGQKKKAIILFIFSFVGSWCFGIGALFLLIGAVDAMKVNEALQAGETVDENEYRFELWYKIAKIVDKDAVLGKQIEG